MAFAKLIVIQPGHPSRELIIDTDLVTIGRALDNVIALDNDSNVSRYHAELERRGDAFLLFDLESVNGTTVNDEPVQSERVLNDGDLISLGGSTIIEFYLSDVPWDTRAVEPEPAEQPSQIETPQVPSIQSPSINVADAAVRAVPPLAGSGGAAAEVPAATAAATGLSPIYTVGGVAGGLLLTGIVAGIFWYTSSRGCQATVRIINPQTGTTITGAVPIRVDAENTDCVDRLIYQLDGVKIASSEIAPYEATLDPADISGLTPGNHVLTVTVEDHKGNRVVQPDEIVLGFETSIASENTESTTTSSSGDGNDRQNTNTRQSLSSADIKDLTEKLLKQLAGNRDYILSRELLHQIDARTTEYASAGFYSRARPFRDVINDSFVNEQGLEKPLGFILALSRSNFLLTPDRSINAEQGEGLWRVPNTLAQSAGYLGRCGTSTLLDKDQKCAAMVAAAYMKALEVDLFGGDVLYGVASFGMDPKAAAQWRDQLPPDRRDIWNVIKSPEQRERVARFLAAGIVGENPSRFGLPSETPLSNLYPK